MSADGGLESVRRAVAELMGYDVDTWPAHGNVPLAVVAVVSTLLNEAYVTTFAGVRLWRGDHQITLTADEASISREASPGDWLKALCESANAQLHQAVQS